jgi:hypothetical protein
VVSSGTLKFLTFDPGVAAAIVHFPRSHLTRNIRKMFWTFDFRRVPEEAAVFSSYFSILSRKKLLEIFLNLKNILS